MKKSILMLISFTIVIGVLGMAFNTAFGYETIMFLSKEQVNINNTHFYIWKIDFWSYIRNIQMAVSNVSVLQFNVPTRSWQTSIDWGSLGNNMLVILDYIIMIINLLLYPLKIGAYLLMNLLAIIGVNQDTNATYNGLSWLISFVRDILANISIPYL